jgi:hypothetical protein
MFVKMENYSTHFKEGEIVRIALNRQKVLKQYNELRVVFEDNCFYGLQDVKTDVIYRSPTSAITNLLNKPLGLHVIFVKRSGGGPFERGIWTPLKDAHTLKWCPLPTL